MEKLDGDGNVHEYKPSFVCSSIKLGPLESDLEAWRTSNKEMFARVLTGSRTKPKLATKFLVDTGNLGRSLISERLAQTLGLQLHPTVLTIKAAQGSKVQIKGETNQMTFVMEQYPTICKWKFLVIKDLCAPGVFGTDFLNANNVGVQLTRQGGNHLTFLDRPELRVPLVTPRAPNLPHPAADARFKEAGIFRQQPCSTAGQSSAALASQHTMGGGAGKVARGAQQLCTATGQGYSALASQHTMGGEAGKVARGGGSTPLGEERPGQEAQHRESGG